MANKTSSRESKIVANLEELLHAFVCDKVTHCCSMIGTNNDTSFEGNSYCACSSFQYTILCFHVSHLIATPYELRGLQSHPTAGPLSTRRLESIIFHHQQRKHSCATVLRVVPWQGNAPLNLMKGSSHLMIS
jgi:hypothetical protein